MGYRATQGYFFQSNITMSVAATVLEFFYHTSYIRKIVDRSRASGRMEEEEEDEEGMWQGLRGRESCMGH